jgi:hypothetical protein
MGGGLMQLVAYGAQDIYLTGNPQITFFKVVYRRHTNFSMEAIQQTLNGSISKDGSTVTSTISRNGDLVGRLWVDALMDRTSLASDSEATTAYAGWTNNTGHALIKECEVEIGGQLIDRHYSQWLDIWNELTDHDEKEWQGLNKHGSFPHTGNASATAGIKSQLYIPLQFWFCRNPGLALPLIALQYHEVKIKLQFRAVSELTNGAGTVTPPSLAPTINLWADYIYLDTDERRRFAQVSHEYLIEQVQKDSGNMSTSKKLNFNHPVKELIWVVQDNVAAGGVNATTSLDPTKTETNSQNFVNGGSISFDTAFTQGNDWFNYQTRENTITQCHKYFNEQQSADGIHGFAEPFNTMNIRLNGHDRFAKRDALYFRNCQPLQAGHKIPKKHIFMYSFALKPEEHQPSGTCNFSRIDNAEMSFTNPAITNTAKTLTIYAVNYNVLRIMSGMGGLAYSN